MELQSSAYVLGACAALLMGFAKAGIPPSAILSVALMTEAFSENAELSVGAMLPVLLVGDVLAVAFYRRHAQLRRLLGLVPYVALGMVLGYLILRQTDGNQLRPVLGWLILALFVLEVLRRRFDWSKAAETWWFAAVLGTAAGFGTMIGNAAGPVMTMYLLGQRLPKEQFIGTCAWFFLLVNTLKIVPFWSEGMITAGTLRFDLIIVPMVPIGIAAGIWVLPRIPQRFFDGLVLVLAGASGMWLIVK